MIIIDGYTIDAAITESHELRAEISSHPIESGGEVVDHRRRLPRVLSIEGVVSDTPFGEIAKIRERTILESSDLPHLPSDEAYTHLKRLDSVGTPITIETSLEVYRNMVLQELTIPRNRAIGDSLRFTASFVEVLIVDTERATVNLPRAKTKSNVGSRAAKPIDADSSRARGPRALASQLHDKQEPHDPDLCGKPHT